MKAFICFLVLFWYFNVVQAQQIYSPNNDSIEITENIIVQLLAENDQSSNFMIWVRDTVAKHKHEYHSETIVVLNGKAKMYFNDDEFIIAEKDVVFIPKNTWHAVKVISDEPLQVMSIQAPRFNKRDRVFFKEE